MIIYNVTSKIDSSIAKNWLHWMLNEHLPEIMNTGYFTNYQIAKLINVDELDGPTYAIQYHANSINDYNKYINEFATPLRQKTQQLWGDKCISIRTLMEVVN